MKLTGIRGVEDLGRNQNSMMQSALKIYNDYVQTRFAVLPSDHRYNSICDVMDEHKINTCKNIAHHSTQHYTQGVVTFIRTVGSFLTGIKIFDSRKFPLIA